MTLSFQSVAKKSDIVPLNHSCPRHPLNGHHVFSSCIQSSQDAKREVSIAFRFFFSSDKECSAVLDIAFIIDSSGSIGRRNWERMKRFLKAIVSKLDVSDSATHVAAVSYSTSPTVEMRFWNNQGTDEVNRVFDRMVWKRRFTYTDKALVLADRDLFQTANGMRPNAPKVEGLGC